MKLRLHIFPTIILLSMSMPFYQAIGASIDLQNSFQTGFEYDTNVYKTYNADRSDSLLRGLFKTSVGLNWPRSRLAMSYRLGGKKYFSQSEQDTIINYFEFELKNFSKRTHISFTAEFKNQVENNSLDPDNYDINEDFFQFKPNLFAKFFLGKGFSLVPMAEFELFDFNSGYSGLSYYEQEYSLAIYKTLGKSTEAGLVYSYDRYDFRDTERTDGTNEIAAFFKYAGPFFLSANYAFQTNNSAIESLSFKNHRISIMASVPIRFQSEQDAQGSGGDLVISLIMTLQFKNYPGVFGVDAEGRRYLLTESEEDNFNVIIFKITKNFTNNFSSEIKYTYHSNAFANTGQDYKRSTYYLGARFSF